jgi:outer membrane lipoprotein-sorting protein
MVSSALTHIVLVLAFALSQTGARAPSADRFTEIYNRSIVRQQTVKTIRATFTETTVSTLLIKPIVAHGTVIAAAPARVRMSYRDPEPKTIVMDGNTLTVAWPNRAPERIDITQVQKRIDRYFTHASIDQLRSMFDIVAGPDPAMLRADLVEMRPKRKPIQEGLERLELWIDRETLLLMQLRMTFPGGDTKTIALDDIAVNVPVSGETFQAPK